MTTDEQTPREALAYLQGSPETRSAGRALATLASFVEEHDPPVTYWAVDEDGSSAMTWHYTVEARSAEEAIKLVRDGEIEAYDSTTGDSEGDSTFRVRPL